MNKRILSLALVGVLIAIFLVNFVRHQQEQKEKEAAAQLASESMDLSDVEKGLSKGDQPPDFILTTLEGKEVRLSDYRGQKVILNFWATWCPPCKAEMPHMEEYYQEGPDAEILAVNLTSQEHVDGAAQKFVDGYKITFPVLIDKDGAVGDAYSIITIPTTFMIDSKGIIQHKILGPMNQEMMKEMVEGMN
ncbi:redoxin domain-containing protein [Rossellomorea marisflavi]|uniref:redoxin domain-containing protein n=1 Tax=Rossellomorea marisflavi TaxID=189381 RepID=UPI003512950C